jgi:hypothetical protein
MSQNGPHLLVRMQITQRPNSSSSIEENMAGMRGEMSYNAVRHYDRCGVIIRPRGRVLFRSWLT